MAGSVSVPGNVSVPLGKANGVSITVLGGTVSIARVAPDVWAAPEELTVTTDSRESMERLDDFIGMRTKERSICRARCALFPLPFEIGIDERSGATEQYDSEKCDMRPLRRD